MENKLSQYTYFFSKENTGYTAMHNSLNLETVFLETDVAKLLQGNDFGKCDTEFVDALKNMGFIVSIDDDESSLLENVRQRLKPGLWVMYLILTDKCNLQCKYCFIEAGFSEDYVCCDMEWETAKKAIDYFRNNLDNSDGLIELYGGEPFVNKDLLFRCVDYINEVAPKMSVEVITNGTLITDNVAKRLLEYPKLQVTVSLDGPEDVHNQQRVFKNNKGTFARTMQGIENLRANGVEFGISCTIAEHNVNDIPDTVQWISDTCGVKSIGINMLIDTCKSLVPEEYMRRANTGLIESFERQRSGDIFESRIMRKVEAFCQKRPRLNDCAGCGNQIVISPQGRIGVCHEGLGERRTFVSDVNDSHFDFYSNESVEEWAKRSPFYMDECLECEALGICGGGCPYGAMLKTGSIHNVDERFCIHSKETLEWLIWDLFDKVKSRTGA